MMTLPFEELEFLKCDITSFLSFICLVLFYCPSLFAIPFLFLFFPIPYDSFMFPGIKYVVLILFGGVLIVNSFIVFLRSQVALDNFHIKSFSIRLSTFMVNFYMVSK